MTSAIREKILITIFAFVILSAFIDIIKSPSLSQIGFGIGIIFIAAGGILDRKNLIKPFRESLKATSSHFIDILCLIGGLMIIVSYITK